MLCYIVAYCNILHLYCIVLRYSSLYYIMFYHRGAPARGRRAAPSARELRGGRGDQGGPLV